MKQLLMTTALVAIAGIAFADPTVSFNNHDRVVVSETEEITRYETHEVTTPGSAGIIINGNTGELMYTQLENGWWRDETTGNNWAGYGDGFGEAAIVNGDIYTPTTEAVTHTVTTEITEEVTTTTTLANKEDVDKLATTVAENKTATDLAINTAKEAAIATSKQWSDHNAGRIDEAEDRLDELESAGVKGDKGDTGAQGDQGERGLQGDKGDQGERGLKGDKGDQGEQGVAGRDGKNGDDFNGDARLTDVETQTDNNTTKSVNNEVRLNGVDQKNVDQDQKIAANDRAIEEKLSTEDLLAELKALRDELKEELEVTKALNDAQSAQLAADEADRKAVEAAKAAKAAQDGVDAINKVLNEYIDEKGQWKVDPFITRTNDEIADIARKEIKAALAKVEKYDDTALAARVAKLEGMVADFTKDTVRSDAEITTLVHTATDEAINANTAGVKANKEAIEALDTRVTANEETLADHEVRITSNTDRITALENKLNNFIDSLKEEAPAAGGGSGGGSSDTKDDKRREWETKTYHEMNRLLFLADGGPVYFTNKWGETIDLRGVQQIMNGDFILKQEYVDATQRHSRWYDVY